LGAGVFARVIGADGSVFDAVSDFVKNAQASGAGGVFAGDEEFGFFVFIEFGGFGGANFLVGVEFAELFEITEFALKGAFGGGFVAEEEIVLLDFIGQPVEGREAAQDHFEGMKVALSADAVPLGLGGFEDEIV
jgi:hypothetical protein